MQKPRRRSVVVVVSTYICIRLVHNTREHFYSPSVVNLLLPLFIANHVVLPIVFNFVRFIGQTRVFYESVEIFPRIFVDCASHTLLIVIRIITTNVSHSPDQAGVYLNDI